MTESEKCCECENCRCGCNEESFVVEIETADAFERRFAETFRKLERAGRLR